MTVCAARTSRSESLVVMLCTLGRPILPSYSYQPEAGVYLSPRPMAQLDGQDVSQGWTSTMLGEQEELGPHWY